MALAKGVRSRRALRYDPEPFGYAQGKLPEGLRPQREFGDVRSPRRPPLREA